MADTKQPTVLSIREAIARLRQLQITHGPSAEITIDDNFVAKPYNRPELAEETPEESAKRADRQAKEALDNAKPKGVEPVFTRPVSAIKEERSKSTRQ